MTTEMYVYAFGDTDRDFLLNLHGDILYTFISGDETVYVFMNNFSSDELDERFYITDKVVYTY